MNAIDAVSKSSPIGHHYLPKKINPSPSAYRLHPATAEASDSKLIYFFRAYPAEKRIINDKYITAFIIGKRFDFSNNRRSKLKRKFMPVDVTEIHEAIKGGLSQKDGN